MQVPKLEVRRRFVHLAYLDDSDTKAKNRKWQVMSGVVMEDRAFSVVEVSIKAIRDLLIPKDKIEQFTEFHACELYGGHGVFEGIEQEKRFAAIKQLLKCLDMTNMSVVYGAVDIRALQKTVYGSADPMDISFRMCVKGIHEWLQDKHQAILLSKGADISEEGIKADTEGTIKLVVETIIDGLKDVAILIVDECDRAVKASLHRSFLGLRTEAISNWHFHDDMYFGDSRYSIGIQLADLCSYFIARHREGDAATEGFYKLIEPHIVYSKTYPPEEVESNKNEW